MRSNYPDRLLVPVRTTKEAIESAKQNKVKMFVADRPTAIFYMRRYGINEEFTNKEELCTMPLRIAVSEGRHQLLDFVMFGWPKIDEKLLHTIHKKWFTVKAPTPNWVLPGVIISLLAIILAFFIRMLCSPAHRID